MKKILFISFCLLTFLSCEKDDFFERFGPEVLFFQYNEVEKADFIAITLDPGITAYTVKARVSAPNKLDKIEVYRDNSLTRSITDFSQEVKETEYFLFEEVSNITASTKIKVKATDKNGKIFEKVFSINK
jgi:hypothetical protein